MPTPVAVNTAISFVTNTNWQSYGGETTMSHLTQMAGLAFHNFVSAACGAAVAVALVRGLVRRRCARLARPLFPAGLAPVPPPRDPAPPRRA